MQNSRFVKTLLAFVAVVAAGVAVRAAPERHLIVVCSPGSPGSTDEAQPRMNAFAAALSQKAGMSIDAVYDPTDTGGANRIASAGMAIVTLPFFLEHAKDLGLHARLDIVQKGRPALDRWALVAQKGRIRSPEDLAGYTIVSSAAFAPGFVRGSAMSGFGALPANVQLQHTRTVVSALRRAAAGERIAVLLDGPEEAALASLPFASQLDVVTHSAPMPAGLVVTVDHRMPEAAWKSVEAALLALRSSPAGAEALDAIQVQTFAPLDTEALAAATKGYLP
jgi:ABC-type phosphate/phosphonate transport system substrate-binding protein